MEVLDKILIDWRSCKPRGVVLPAAKLNAVLECVRARVNEFEADAGRKEDARSLLVPDTSMDGSIPFERLLCIVSEVNDKTHGMVDDTNGSKMIHFLRFWQASYEVWQKLRQSDADHDEPIAQEIATFFDVLLRRFDHGNLTWHWLVEWTAAIRNMSADEIAWATVEFSIGQVASTMELQKSSKQELQLDEVSALLIVWLHELVEDYCHGDRAAKIRSIQDATGSKRHQACMCLSQDNWDIEAALLSFCGGGPKVGATCVNEGSAWSSGGVKLRKNEVDCPICCVPYSEGSKSVMTHCCFQVLCQECRGKLTDSGRFSCPFCRGINDEELPPQWELQEDNQSDSRGERGHWGRALLGVRRFVGGLNAVVHAERPAGIVIDRIEGPRATQAERIIERIEGPRRRRGGSRATQNQTYRRAAPWYDSFEAPMPSPAAPCRLTLWEKAQQIGPACLLCSIYLVWNLCGGAGVG